MDVLPLVIIISLYLSFTSLLQYVTMRRCFLYKHTRLKSLSDPDSMLPCHGVVIVGVNDYYEERTYTCNHNWHVLGEGTGGWYPKDRLLPGDDLAPCE